MTRIYNTIKVISSFGADMVIYYLKRLPLMHIEFNYPINKNNND
jgi:hypothetical protein